MFDSQSLIVAVMDVVLSIDLPEAPVIVIDSQGSSQLSELISLFIPSSSIFLSGFSYRSFYSDQANVSHVAQDDVPPSDLFISLDRTFYRKNHESYVSGVHRHYIYFRDHVLKDRIIVLLIRKVL